MNGFVAVHGPNFCAEVIGSAHEQVAAWVPLNRIDFVGVTSEGLDYVSTVHVRDPDCPICRASSEGSVVFPVDIERWLRVARVDRQRLASARVPHDCSLVDAARKQKIARGVPL